MKSKEEQPGLSTPEQDQAPEQDSQTSEVDALEFQETLKINVNDVLTHEAEIVEPSGSQEVVKSREMETDQSLKYKVNHPVSKYLREVLDPKIPATPEQFMRMIWRDSLGILRLKDIEETNTQLHHLCEIIKYNSVIAYKDNY
ncbi:hypothetical protein ACFL21_02025 [Patescibacteria group bacterium]